MCVLFTNVNSYAVNGTNTIWLCVFVFSTHNAHTSKSMYLAKAVDNIQSQLRALNLEQEKIAHYLNAFPSLVLNVIASSSLTFTAGK